MCHHAQGDEAKYRRADELVIAMHRRVRHSLIEFEQAGIDVKVTAGKLQDCIDYMTRVPDGHHVGVEELANITLQAQRALTRFHAASQYHLIQRAYYEGALRRQQELVTKNQQDLADIRELAGKLGS